MKLLLFYAGLLYGTYDKWPRKHEIPEVYDGGYVYCVESGSFGTRDHWYRCDATPYPTDQVPPELRMQALLLT